MLIGIARKIIQRVGETPEALRDLSVSLEKVGDIADRMGRFEEARNAHEEAYVLLENGYQGFPPRATI